MPTKYRKNKTFLKALRLAATIVKSKKAAIAWKKNLKSGVKVEDVFKEGLGIKVYVGTKRQVISIATGFTWAVKMKH